MKGLVDRRKPARLYPRRQQAGTHEHERGLLEARDRPQAIDQFQASHPGQVVIEQNEVGNDRPDELQGFKAIGREDDSSKGTACD